MILIEVVFPICKTWQVLLLSWIPAGDDNTVTFSFGSLVEKIKKGLTASAVSLRGGKSSNAGLSVPPAPIYLPKNGLSVTSKGNASQRMQAMSDGKHAAHMSLLPLLLLQ